MRDREPGPDHARAAAALARGLPLSALNAIERRDDAHALALRGIALAQLQEHAAARGLLERAAELFAKQRRPRERARALAAAAELAAAQRDLRAADQLFDRSIRGLRRCGDRRNAAWTLAVQARLCALRGRFAKSRVLIARAIGVLPAKTDGSLRMQLALARAELAARDLDGAAATAGIELALRSFEGPSALAAEASELAATMRTGVARLRRGDVTAPIDALALTRILRGSGWVAATLAGTRRLFVVDSIARRAFFPKGRGVDLRRRPVMLNLLGALERRWPKPVLWRELGRDVFEIARAEESVLARCKVEIDRLRRLLPAPAKIIAARSAWRLELPRACAPVFLSLERATEGSVELCAALLDDGAAWSVADLAAVTGQSRSSVLRNLKTLERTGRARATGEARARRYVATSPAGIASQMLLVGLLAPRRR